MTVERSQLYEWLTNKRLPDDLGDSMAFRLHVLYLVERKKSIVSFVTTGAAVAACAYLMSSFTLNIIPNLIVVVGIIYCIMDVVETIEMHSYIHKTYGKLMTKEKK